MSKIVQALLTGIFFTFILDFFIFLGIKLNYIDFYEIDLYYNILFADNQNIYIFSFFSILIGFIITYINKNKITFSTLGLFFFFAMLTLIEPIGYSLGESMFMKKNSTLKDKKFTFYGDIYYEGRTKITFYDHELKKTILLNKKDLIK
ncbi:hypothetical protein HUE87_09170 [Candidatus Sulfurimonas marisnigri]|uniref:Uncharacterized protein n=1 Tax=Candidatus Sulfurimonas marisnigri TaxID=2740405 RepID=A0A7S7M015_9BACT|nr:hypothetical protein [Candidatus Sulfurimonas marisnigri]QOY54048.1 hypothetical protein HUE87_09170 [Candidatus Sulfurimonas marisnigri]